MTARVFGRRAVLAGLSVQQEPSAAWGAAAAGVSDCTAWAASCSGGFQQEPIGRRAVLAGLSVQQEPSALVRPAVLLLQE